MDDEEDNRYADAGIGHVKGRPGMGVGNVKIEKEEIDYVPVEQAISQISKYSSQQERERNIAPFVRHALSAQQEYHHEQ
jgi:hypothetical protein